MARSKHRKDAKKQKAERIAVTRRSQRQIAFDKRTKKGWAYFVRAAGIRLKMLLHIVFDVYLQKNTKSLSNIECAANLESTRNSMTR